MSLVDQPSSSRDPTEAVPGAGGHAGGPSPGQRSPTWCRCPDDLIDEGILAQLSECALRLLMVFLRHNKPHSHAYDARSGTVESSINDLARVTGRSRSSVYQGIKELIEHPRSLLARCGPNKYLVLPGWVYAARTQGAASAPSHPAGSVGSHASPRPSGSAARPLESSRAAGASSTGVDRVSTVVDACPQWERARASQTERTKTIQKPEQEFSMSSLAGCPENIQPQPKAPGTSIEDRLRRLGVRDPLLGKVLAIPDLTIEDVEQVIREVCDDPTVKNRAAIVARRLFERNGLPVPEKSRRDQAVPEDLRRLIETQQRRRFEASA